jgi:hypothetical protein
VIESIRIEFGCIEAFTQATNRELFIRLRFFRDAARLQVLDESRKEIMSMVTINADKKRTFTVAPVDAKGRPARIDGIPEWTVTPEGGVTLFPTTDGLSCDVVWQAPLASQVVTVKADADLGSGVRHITGTADVETLSAEAASFQMTASEESDV